MAKQGPLNEEASWQLWGSYSRDAVPAICHNELLRCTLTWQWSQSLEQAARNLITKYNVTVIVASGNSEEDSCYISPGTPFL